MKILMTTDTVGGVWTYSLELARSLAPFGVQVALATMGAPVRADQAREAAAIRSLDLIESVFRLEWMEEPWEDVQAAGEWLLGLERRLRPDVVHLNGYAHGALPWHAPTLVVGHSCVFSWWEACRGGAPPPEWDRYQREVARGLRHADLVAAPTWSMLAALECHYGRLSRGVVIPNGRDPDRYLSRPKQPVVFSGGRLWDEAKNIGALDAVARELDWPVWVAGDCHHPEGGERRVASVHLLGQLSGSEMADWLGRASIFALPAKYEPFGLSALEAAFAGCALVLGDIPTLREVWEDAACFVPLESSVALRDTLQALIHDPDLRHQMAQRARRRAREFTAERMANGYAATYRRLCSMHAGHPALAAAREDAA